jgi:hypothetical protein
MAMEALRVQEPEAYCETLHFREVAALHVV